MALAARRLAARALRRTQTRRFAEGAAAYQTKPLPMRADGEPVPEYMNFTLACPHKTLLDEESVRLVTIPGAGGAFGAMAGHIPIVCELQPGIISVYYDKQTTSGKSSHYYVAAGFCMVHSNSNVEISAADACLMSSLDATAVTNGMTKAKENIATAEKSQDP